MLDPEEGAEFSEFLTIEWWAVVRFEHLWYAKRAEMSSSSVRTAVAPVDLTSLISGNFENSSAITIS